MSTTVPVCIHPTQKLSYEDWYDMYKYEIDDIIDFVSDMIEYQNTQMKNITITYDYEELAVSIIEHLYETSYNTDKKWTH